MKFNKVLLLMTLLLSACVKNEELVPGGHISAVMESEQTKTSVTDEGSFTWSAGDKVWIGTTSGGVVGTLSDGAGTSKAEFTYGTFFGEMTGNAVYPYNSGHKVKDNELSVVLPASYDLGTSLSNTNAVMYGVNVGGTFQFSHLAGVMRFKFKNVPAGTDRFQITLDKKVNGTFVVDLASDQPVVESVASSEDADRTITMNFAPLQSASDIALYIPLPVGTYTSLSLDLWAGEQSVWTYSNTVTNTISRKTLKLMPTITLGGTVGGDIVGGDSEYQNNLVQRLNSNVQAIQTILIAIQQNDYVTEIMKVMEDGEEIGYSITLSEYGTVIIYYGSDGNSPKISVRKASDGEYYWTSGDEWLTDDSGNKLPVTAVVSDGSRVTPQFRVAEGVWYVSFDNGNTWRKFEGGATSCIKSVIQDAQFVYLTLSDDTVITIPCGTMTEDIYASTYGVVPGEVDPENMAKLLSDASAYKKTIRFNGGTYIFSSTINVPSDVSLVGSTQTVFKPVSETSPMTLMSIEGSDNVFISHITFDGGLTSKPAQEGTQVGLSVISCRSVNIENVEFVGWSKQGLYSKTMSSYGEEEDGKFFKHFQITNCRFYFNYCGNYFDYRCEYSQMLNCVWGENYIGTVNCGGNNSYVSCQWNANYTGFQMENDGSNPAHGGCNGCTFNHNDNQAIQIDDCVNGWTFEGCQVFYGKIVLNKSKGVIFNGNIWGSCRFYSTFPGEKNVNMITSTYFQTERNVILAGNDGSTKVVNCIPEEEEITNVIEDQEWTRLVYTINGINSGASDCYFAHCSTPVSADAHITNLYIAINAANQNSVVQGVNVWVVDANTDTVIEKIVDNKNMQVQYSASLSKYVLNIEHDRTYNHPIYFIAQATRTSGVGIAYASGSANSSYLSTELPAVGDVIVANSSIEAEFAVYCNNNNVGSNVSDGSNILAGKILVTIGDSITYGADMQMESNGLIENPGPNEGKYKSYGWQIAQRNNMVFYQKGISGSTMQGAVNPNGTDKGDISKKNGFSKENGRYTQLPEDIDFMTIMFGWNDAAYGTLGTIDDSTNETYYGGFNVVLPYLIHKYPYTTIVLIVPFGTTEGHRQAVRNMAQRWGVGCFDMCANDLPFYYSEESDDVAVNEEIKKLRIALNQVNGAHPGYQGHYAIGTRLEDYLRKCGCYDRENAIFYKVSYLTAHGTAPKTVEKVKVLYSTLFPTLTADGYIFKGWYMDSEFKTKATAGKVLNSDITLYAKWDVDTSSENTSDRGSE